MTTAHAIARDYRLRLITHETSAALTLEFAHMQMLRHLDQPLRALYRQIEEAQQQQSDQRGSRVISLSWLYEHNRLEHLLSYVTTAMQNFATVAHVAIGHLLHTAAQLGQQSGMAQVRGASVHPAPTSNLTQRVAHASEFVAGRLDSMARTVAGNVQGALLMGLSLGLSVAAIGRRIAQALDAPRWQARALARNGAFGVYRGVEMDVWVENDAGYWIWRAQPGACKFCTSMDGTRHPVDEEMESHGNCRCDKELEAA